MFNKNTQIQLQCSHKAQIAFVSQRSYNEHSSSSQILVPVEVGGARHLRHAVVEIIHPVIPQHFKPIETITKKYKQQI